MASNPLRYRKMLKRNSKYLEKLGGNSRLLELLQKKGITPTPRILEMLAKRTAGAAKLPDDRRLIAAKQDQLRDPLAPKEEKFGTRRGEPTIPAPKNIEYLRKQRYKAFRTRSKAQDEALVEPYEPAWKIQAKKIKRSNKQLSGSQEPVRLPDRTYKWKPGPGEESRVNYKGEREVGSKAERVLGEHVTTDEAEAWARGEEDPQQTFRQPMGMGKDREIPSFQQAVPYERIPQITNDRAFVEHLDNLQKQFLEERKKLRSSTKGDAFKEANKLSGEYGKQALDIITEAAILDPKLVHKNLWRWRHLLKPVISRIGWQASENIQDNQGVLKGMAGLTRNMYRQPGKRSILGLLLSGSAMGNAWSALYEGKGQLRDRPISGLLDHSKGRARLARILDRKAKSGAPLPTREEMRDLSDPEKYREAGERGRKLVRGSGIKREPGLAQLDRPSMHSEETMAMAEATKKDPDAWLGERLGRIRGWQAMQRLGVYPEDGIQAKVVKDWKGRNPYPSMVPVQPRRGPGRGGPVEVDEAERLLDLEKENEFVKAKPDKRSPFAATKADEFIRRIAMRAAMTGQRRPEVPQRAPIHLAPDIAEGQLLLPGLDPADFRVRPQRAAVVRPEDPDRDVMLGQRILPGIRRFLRDKVSRGPSPMPDALRAIEGPQEPMQMMLPGHEPPRRFAPGELGPAQVLPPESAVGGDIQNQMMLSQLYREAARQRAHPQMGFPWHEPAPVGNVAPMGAPMFRMERRQPGYLQMLFNWLYQEAARQRMAVQGA